MISVENDGFLTLVSPTFFAFGKDLMKRNVNAFSQSRIWAEGNNFIKAGQVDVMNDEQLKKATSFLT
jgi:hypothetical protein